MHKTVSREFVSSNFKFLDIGTNQLYDRNQLFHKIDIWKYILVEKYKATAGESILIGMQKIGMDYFAIIFAAAELSVKIVVVDYNRTDGFKNLQYNDPKTKLLSPIDIFLHDFPIKEVESNPKIYAKFIFFKNHSRRTYSTIEVDDIQVDNVRSNQIAAQRPNPSDILFRVTSSGTTDIPKVIEHTHEFIYTISKRNSKMYKGTALHVGNLNHGASASVTLLPLLTADSVGSHLFYDHDPEIIEELVEAVAPYKDSLGYLSFPYPFLIDRFVEHSRKKNLSWPNLDMITLSYILEGGKLAVRDGIINSITSIFGSNETLGPVFLNTSTKDNWNIDSRRFIEYDDFYKIDLSPEGKITVTIPVYNKEVSTNDYFEKDGNHFVHHGRSDMFRINGETINLSTINELNKKNTDSYVVVDTLNHCLYLACWKEMTMVDIEKIKKEVEDNFTRVKITKILQLEKSHFYYAIKIDNELLREHFRTTNV